MNHSPSNEPQPYGGTQLGLLILVMTLFIALWESDSKHHRQVAARDAAKKQQQVAKRQATSPVRLVSKSTVVESAFKQVKLPVGIVPGEYRLISSAGNVESRSISAGDIRKQGLKPGRDARDFYLTDSDDARVYFIRVTGAEKVAQREVGRK